MISPFQAGDILFLHRSKENTPLLDRLICFFQSLKSGYTSTRTHCAFFVSPLTP